jgi:N-acyl-D-amino-acid deacylase
MMMRSIRNAATIGISAALISAISSSWCRADDTNDPVSHAIASGTQVLLKGVENYPNHRSCFSCHHQTLPLLALSLKDRSEPLDHLEEFRNNGTTKSILDFTESSFANKRDSMREGTGVGGRALTVAYGMWAMDLAGTEPNDTTNAMVEYLLQTQSDDGAWEFQSHRPPAASSRTMTTAISVYGLRAYANREADEPAIQRAYDRALSFLDANPSPKDHEDLIGSIWLGYMLRECVSRQNEESKLLLKSISDRMENWIDRLIENQQPDGGWRQTDETPSDAYATGQALLMIAQTRYDKHAPHRHERFQRGIRFLLDTQKPDGSWHVVSRSKPVQVYFDNGDPHGTDQFISMMGTSWATAALANYQSTGRDPLESTQVLLRAQRAFANTQSELSTTDPFANDEATSKPDSDK